jgi:hypothetical protein
MPARILVVLTLGRSGPPQVRGPKSCFRHEAIPLYAARIGTDGARPYRQDRLRVVYKVYKNGRKRWSGISSRDLARISHQASTAAADPGMSTALRSVGLLDVLSSTPAGPSVARLVSTPVCTASLRILVRNAG